MSDPAEQPDPSVLGESFSSRLEVMWINPRPIAAGEAIAPAKLSSKAAHAFAALHLVLGDLEFAASCLIAADELGIPDDNSLHSKALIFSGVVAYARCFKSGVRAVTLKPEELKAKGAIFDDEVHDYLIAMRDKHVAHSVNAFEQCEPVAIMVGRPGAEWRDGSAIGVVRKQSVGASRAIVRRAISHIAAIKQAIESVLPAQRAQLLAEFQESLKNGGKWEIAPIATVSDPGKVAERRR